MNQSNNDLITESNVFLPEASSGSVKPGWVKKSDLILNDECELTLTFVNEGAGYKNALSYYVYDKENPPAKFNDINNVYVVFPNCSKVNSGGSMVNGYTMRLAYEVTSYDMVNNKRYATGLNYTFPAGSCIGFVIHANRWKNNGTSNAFLSTGHMMYSSDPNLNPEPRDSLRHHVINYRSVVDPSIIMYGMEDVLRTRSWCDHDFNDLIFYVTPSVFSAIDVISYNNTISNNYKGVFVCEDLLNRPNADLDYNDLGGTYKVCEELSDSDNVKSITIEIVLMSRGASLNHHFGVVIPKIKNIDGVVIEREQHLFDGSVTYEDITSSIVGQGTDKVPIIMNTKTSFPDDSTSFTNTLENDSITTPSIFRLKIDFGINGVLRESINGCEFPYNFYLDVMRGEKNMWTLYSDTDYTDVPQDLLSDGITTRKKILLVKGLTTFRFPIEKQAFHKVYYKYKSFLLGNSYFSNWHNIKFARTHLLFPTIGVETGINWTVKFP